MQSFRVKFDQAHTNMGEPVIFSGGEVHVDISGMPSKCHDWNLKARCQSGNDFMHMLMLVDALKRRYPDADGSVTIPYLPYSRQDRMCADGQHFGLSVIVNLLRTLGNVRLYTYDVHSNVALDLLTEAGVQHINLPQWKILSNSHLSLDIRAGDLQVVAPDKGAAHKASKVALLCKSPLDVIYATKTRNPKNGWLETDKLNVDLHGQDVIIVDDICDGGATFLGLAKELKAANAGKINLYVTHGIFSKGFACFSGLVDTIYTTDSFRRENLTATHRGTVAKDVKLDTIMV